VPEEVASRPVQQETLLAAHRLFGRMDINQTEVDLTEVVILAQQTGLTSYDASYLWLARRLQAELVTLDMQLARTTIEL
jgi:predicted nucleic acid-binding protein